MGNQGFTPPRGPQGQASFQGYNPQFGPPPQQHQSSLKRPFWKRGWFIAPVSSFLIGLMVGFAASGTGQESTPHPTATVTVTNTPEPSPVPTVTAVETVTAEAEPEEQIEPEAETTQQDSPEPKAPSETATAADTAMAEQEALAVVEAYIDERAASGVMFAQAVTKTSVSQGVITAVFDPSAVGWDRETFESLSPFDNLAEFVGLELCWATPEAAAHREVISEVRTQYPDGESLGSRTTDELHELCVG